MQNPLPGKQTVHYGWVIVFAGMLCIVACLGFGRFALGMLLPSMAATLRLSYSQMGFISTANFLGYLASVLVSAHWAGRIGSRRLIFLALLTVAVSMALVSRATGFLSVLLLYMITGVGSGATNVPVMGLIAAWFSSGRRGRAAGFIVIGSGFAIMHRNNINDWRMFISGRKKLDQILNAFSDSRGPEHQKYVCAPCSNCKGQMRDMIRHYDLMEKESLAYGGLVELIVNAMVDVKPGFIKWDENE